jgi:hypothetical protein
MFAPFITPSAFRFAEEFKLSAGFPSFSLWLIDSKVFCFVCVSVAAALIAFTSDHRVLFIFSPLDKEEESYASFTAAKLETAEFSGFSLKREALFLLGCGYWILVW